MARKIASNYLWSPSGFISNPLIEVESTTGEILSLSNYESIDNCEGVEFYSGILSPGFINSHCHLELSHLKGDIDQGIGLSAFAGSISSLRGKYEDSEILQAINYYDHKMWSDGIQGVGDISNSKDTFITKSNSKLLYHTFIEAFGLRGIDFERFETLEEFRNSSLTPHSIYSVQDRDFRKIVSSNDSPLSIHFMESKAESELFAKSGDLWNWYQEVGFECDFLHYTTPAERIISIIPPERSIILVHNCFVTQKDIELIMNHFTAPVWWCLCPRSNKYISNIEPPIALLRSNGLNICLGTDSLASNHSLSIFDEMLSMSHTPLHDLLMWGSKGGAQALGFDNCGEVSVGNRCGLIHISALNYDTMTLTPKSRAKRIV